MRASKGGLTHAEIMKLSWRQFWVYMDAFVYVLREESEEGRKENKHDDDKAAAQDPRVRAYRQKRLEEARKETEGFKTAQVTGEQKSLSDLLG